MAESCSHDGLDLANLVGGPSVPDYGTILVFDTFVVCAILRQAAWTVFDTICKATTHERTKQSRAFHSGFNYLWSQRVEIDLSHKF